MAEFQIDSSLGYLMYLAGARMRQAIQRRFIARGHAITLPQWFILNRLWEEEGLTQNDLADRTFRDKTTTARTVALLERQRLLERRRDPTDQRSYLVSLTPAGRALKDELTPIASTVNALASAGLSDDQLAELKAMLRTIYANLAGEAED